MSTAEHFDTPDVSVWEEALAAWDAGMCPVRIATNGRKKIIAEFRGNYDGSGRKKWEWGHYSKERPTRETVDEWFKDGHPGLGIVCGEISGGLEMFEFEGAAAAEGMFERFVQMLEDNGLLDLWDRISAGWSEMTPSGGIHVYYRWTPEEGERPGNEKIATRPDPEDPTKKVQTLVETRGEGGFSVIAPSHGKTSSIPGRAWTRYSGGPSTVATITPAERAAIHAIAHTFHVEPARKAEEPPKRAPRDTPIEDGGWMDKVVSDLNRRPWAEVLGDYGWTYSHSEGDEDYWCRPGKTKAQGHSATTNAKGTDRFIVFSSSTPFEPYTGTGQAPSYDRLDVIAHYDHGGDRVAAAKDLDPNTREDWINAQRKSDRRFLKSVPGYRGSAWDDDDQADDTVDEQEPTGTIPEACPCLPDEFWSARPQLQHIRQAAHSKGTAADGVLGATLARISFLTNHNFVLDDIIRYSNTNIIVGLVGRSGAGKGTSMELASRLVPYSRLSFPRHQVVTAGSGEGIPRAFYEVRPATDDTGAEIKGKTTVERYYDSVLIDVAEGDVLVSIGKRQGSTLWSVLKSAFSGEDLGFNNADKERRFPVNRLSYRLAVCIAIQPTIAAGLLEDREGGTPQRITWHSLTDPHIPDIDHLPDFPGQLEWKQPDWQKAPERRVIDGYNRSVITIDPQIRRNILSEHLAKNRGTLVVDEMKSQRSVMLYKIGALLAILDGRYHVTQEDWELAEMVVDTSDQVREWTEKQIDAKELLRQYRADVRHAERAVLIGRSTNAAQATAVRVGKVIARHVHAKHADGSSCKAKCLKDAVGSADRDNLGDGRAHAVSVGWVEQDERGWLTPGESAPIPPKAKAGAK